MAAIAFRMSTRFTKDGGAITREVEDIFTDILERVKRLDPANARKWFEKLTVRHFDGGSLIIGCPDEATVHFLHDKCRAGFTRAAQQITGHLVTVEFSADSEVKSEGRAEDSKGRFRESVAYPQPGRNGRKMEALRLHPDYTFDNFVVGPSNRLAHASCVAVSQSLGNTYNPLFVYGSSGLGKTHLLHAVCFEAQRKSGDAQIQFVSCENFVNRFISKPNFSSRREST